MDESTALDADAVTPEMIEAGANRLADLLEAEVGLSYVAEGIWLAMRRASASLPRA